MTLVYFVLSSFDVLDALDQMHLNRQKLVNTIYNYQIANDDELLGDDQNEHIGRWGFRGSFSSGINNRYDTSHIALTYCALCSLIILGDDLKQVNRLAILKRLNEYQKKDGCFYSSPGGESDIRLIYCATAICYILNDFSSIDIDKMIYFIMNSLTYEGAFGQNPGCEAHGGSTFCKIKYN